MTRDALASIAAHTPCRETCACWARGATDEAKLRQPRPGIRQLAGYIRAVSDSEPGLSDEGMARRVAAVFIPATLDATRKLADEGLAGHGLTLLAAQNVLNEFDYWTSPARPAADGGTVRIHKFSEVQPSMERALDRLRALLLAALAKETT